MLTAPERLLLNAPPVPLLRLPSSVWVPHAALVLSTYASTSIVPPVTPPNASAKEPSPNGAMKSVALKPIMIEPVPTLTSTELRCSMGSRGLPITGYEMPVLTFTMKAPNPPLNETTPANGLVSSTEPSVMDTLLPRPSSRINIRSARAGALRIITVANTAIRLIMLSHSR